MNTLLTTASQTAPRQAKAPRRRFSGTVINLSGAKTIRVAIESTKMHPKYRKQYVSRRRYAVHDEKGVARPGDTVWFEECRPLSRTKRWRLVSVLNDKTA